MQKDFQLKHDGFLLFIGLFITTFQVVKALVYKSSHINIYDCLLLAISKESTGIAEVILEHRQWPSVKVNCQGHLAPFNHMSTYPPDMTPLIMAAHHNCYLIVQKLLDMGEVIQKPHSSV